MPLAPPASALLQRIRPWLSKAVHVRWTLHRSFYQHEADALLMRSRRYQGRMPPDLALRLEGFLGRLHREWFGREWRKNPTYAEVVRDFRWWLDIAERWSEPPARGRARPTPRQAAGRSRRRGSRRSCSASARCRATPRAPQFLTAWRRFLKENHPDLNPGQSAEERRRFAEALALWRR